MYYDISNAFNKFRYTAAKEQSPSKGIAYIQRNSIHGLRIGDGVVNGCYGICFVFTGTNTFFFFGGDNIGVELSYCFTGI